MFDKVLVSVLKRQKPEGDVYTVVLERNGSAEYFRRAGDPLIVVGQDIHFDLRPSQYTGGAPTILLKANNVQTSFNSQKVTKRDEAMISAVAIVKSALEGGAISISDTKAYLVEFHDFFSNFNSHERQENGVNGATK